MKKEELRDFVSWSQETKMADAIIVALTASLVREYLSRKVRLTYWPLILVLESMHTMGRTGMPKYVIKICQSHGTLSKLLVQVTSWHVSVSTASK